MLSLRCHFSFFSCWLILLLFSPLRHYDIDAAFADFMLFSHAACFADADGALPSAAITPAIIDVSPAIFFMPCCLIDYFAMLSMTPPPFSR
jgi:hypothetical protein